MSRYAPAGPLGCGGAPLGNLFAPVSDADARATLDAAWDTGVRTFDTAPFYGFGLSERRFGQALRAQDRDAYALMTKVGRLLDPVDAPAGERFGFRDGLAFAPRFDYSADGARRSLDDSRERLGIARIDVAFIHDVGEDTHGPAWRAMFEQAMAGAAPALERARAAGEIRAYGLGVNRVEPCLMALRQADPDIFLVAGRYTLLDHSALPELLPACAARGVRVVIGGPYNSGLLAGGTTFDYEAAPPALVEKVHRIEAACQAHGVALKAAALQFCAAHPVVAAVIPGARTAAEMRENAAMMTAPIPAAFWQALRDDGLLPADAPTP